MKRPAPFISSPIVLPSSRAPLLQRRPPPTPPSISPAEHSSSFSGEKAEFEWEQNETCEERRRRKSGRAGVRRTGSEGGMVDEFGERTVKKESVLTSLWTDLSALSLSLRDAGEVSV